MSYARTYNPNALRNGEFPIMVERFNSADEIVTVSDSRSLRDTYIHQNTRSGFDPNWEGVSSWKEATDLMRYGYTPFVERWQGKLDFTARGDGVRTAFRNDIVGFAPVVPLSIIGVPNCMVNTYKKPIRNKVVSVYFDKVALCDKSSRQIEEACARLLSAIINVEMQGYRVNLYITQCHSNGKRGDMLCFKVKDSNTPFDLQRLSFTLAHPAFFRVIGFDWFKRCPTAKITDYGLGHNLGRDFSHEKITEAYEQIFGEKCVVFELEDIIRRNEQSLIESIQFANKRYA